MLKLKKVAITGGISSGKTLFCHYLEELGSHYVSADKIVHQLLSPNTKLGRQVVDLLGEIDRSKIAEKVFRDRGLLEQLEKILHPAVFEKIEDEYKTISNKGKVPLFIAEIPLLFETGGEHFFDTTIAVIADEAECLKRVKDESTYFARMERQLKPSIKAERADIVIMNNGSKEDLQKKAQDTFVLLTKV